MSKKETTDKGLDEREYYKAIDLALRLHELAHYREYIEKDARYKYMNHCNVNMAVKHMAHEIIKANA